MFMRIWKIMAIILSFAVYFPIDAHAVERKTYRMGGGPSGGTFQLIAGGIMTSPPIKSLKQYKILASSSNGSVENLRKINSGKFAIGVVYSGHLYMGHNRLLKNDPRQYKKAMAVAYIYGAPAQLIVRKNSNIKSVRDLAGKKVGVGNAGSGAFANCELFFSHLNLWDKIERNAMGYNDAAMAFGNNLLDAFWVFVNYPASSVMMAAQTNDIELIDLFDDAEKTNFFEHYPFFSKATIPEQTYKGISHPVNSFQDSALLVANRDVPSDDIYLLLKAVYSNEGLSHIKTVTHAADSMNLNNGIAGIATPLHEGAEKFWRERGIMK